MRRLPARSRPGFSLTEILVAVCVLGIFVLLFAKFTTNMTMTSTLTRKAMECDGQARLVFDRMASDFAALVRRPDIDCHLGKAPGNDRLAFFCETPGYYSGGAVPAREQRHPVSLVGYRVFAGSDGGRPACRLERLSKGFGWEAQGGAWGDLAALPSTIVSGPNARWPDLFGTSPSDPDFQILGDQVFRFEFLYLLKDGTLSPVPVEAAAGKKNDLGESRPPGPSDDAAAGFSSGSRWFDAAAGQGYVCLDDRAGAAVWGAAGVSDLGAIVVALAVLDATSRLAVADYGSLAAAFPDAVASRDLLASWKAAVSDPGFAGAARLAPAAASSVRVYQRYFYFPRP